MPDIHCRGTQSCILSVYPSIAFWFVLTTGQRQTLALPSHSDTKICLNPSQPVVKKKVGGWILTRPGNQIQPIKSTILIITLFCKINNKIINVTIKLVYHPVQLIRRPNVYQILQLLRMSASQGSKMFPQNFADCSLLGFCSNACKI